jgi:glycogen debranching enzyme
VETSEYVTAVEWAFRWTGDRAFLDEVYPLCRTGIFDYLLGACDPQGDLLPDGPGLLELRTAEHGKKLDVACSLYQALQSLAYLAEVVGDSATAARCTALAGQVAERINRYFWVPARQEYVWRVEPDLSVAPDEPAHSYAVLEMGVLGAEQAGRIARLFATIEGPAHTGPAGVIHPGTADFVMPIQNAIVALAEFRYGRPDKGLWYLERMAELCGYYMPGAIPEFVGPEACFLQAWSSAAYNWLLVQGFFRLNPDPARGVVTVQPQLPAGWDHLEVSNLAIWGTPCRLRLERTATGIDFTGEIGATGRPLSFEVIAEAPVPAQFA